MLPTVYQTTLQAHLTDQQYLTLQLLLCLLQVHRQVKLSVLANVFPQTIQYGSRKRNLETVCKRQLSKFHFNFTCHKSTDTLATKCSS